MKRAERPSGNHWEAYDRAIKTLWVLLFVALTEAVHGNAKVTWGAILDTERVEVAMEGDTAVVKGEFRFRPVTERTAAKSDGTRVYFPLVRPRGASPTVEQFKFALVLNGTKATSYAITTNAPLAVPESADYSVVWIVATFPDRGYRRAYLEVSYEQPLLDGVFYYLPIVEGTRHGAEGLSITVQSDRPIHSEGKGPGGVVALGPRKLVFVPAHLGMIVVRPNG